MKSRALLVIGVVFLLMSAPGQQPAAQVAAAPAPPPTLEAAIAIFIGQLPTPGPGRLSAITALGDIAVASRPWSTDAPTGLAGRALVSWKTSVQSQREREARIGRQLQPAITPLVALLSDVDPAERREAARALGEMHATAAADSVSRLITDGTQPSVVRQVALIAAARIGGETALPVLRASLADGGGDLGMAAASIFALEQIGQAGLPALRMQLLSSEWPRRAWALDAIAKFKLEGAAAADLAASLVVLDPDPRVRMAAMKAIAAIAPGRAKEIDKELAETRPLVPANYDLLPAERRALLEAARGQTPIEQLRITSFSRAPINGEYAQSTQSIVYACVEDAAAEQIRYPRQVQRGSVPELSLRIAAAHVAGDGAILRAASAVVNTGARAATCTKMRSARLTDPTEWPLVGVEYTSYHQTAGTLTSVSWDGLIDPATGEWKHRYPGWVARVRPDLTVFSDQLRLWETPERERRLAARFAGMDMPIVSDVVDPAVFYDRAHDMNFPVALPFVVPAAAVATAPWLDIRMYGGDMSGTRPAPKIPPGVVITFGGMTALVVPPEPPGAAAKLAFWRSHLRHQHLGVRMHAAGILAQLNDRQSLRDMAAILTAPTDIAGEVVQAIAHFGAEAAPIVGPLLADPREHVRNAAAAVLSNLGPASLPHVLAALKGNDDVRAKALKVLVDLKPSQAAAAVGAVVPELEGCSNPTRSLMVCFAAIEAVLRAGPAAAPARAPLEQIVRDADTSPYVRSRAAAALFVAGNHALAREVLERDAMEALDSDAEQALGALVGVARADAVPVLVKALQRRDAPRTNAAAARMLGQLGDPAAVALPVIAEQLRNSDAAVRLRVVPALSQLRSPRALQLLGRALTDRDTQTATAAIGIVKQRGAETIPILIPALDNPSYHVRHEAVSFAGGLGHAAAASAPLMTALRRVSKTDENAAVRGAATRALERIGQAK